MTDYPKVLVAAPVYNKMEYCIKEFFDSVRNIDYPNYKILLVENSEGDEFFDKISGERRIKVVKYNSDEKVKMKRLIDSRNIILKYGVENNYDFILMMDCDVMPPSNIIGELLNCHKDAVSGLYYNHFIVDNLKKWLPVCWKIFSDKEFDDIKTKYTLPEVIKSKEDMPRHITPDEAGSGELLEIFHPSAGCMLLSRKAFENAKYHTEYKNGLLCTDDIPFVKNLRENGFKIYCYTKVLCKHLVEGKYEKDKDGNLVHPGRIDD